MYYLDPVLVHNHLMRIGNLKLSSLIHVDGMMRDHANYDIDKYILDSHSRRFAQALIEFDRIESKRDKEREAYDRMFGGYPREDHLAQLYVFKPMEMQQLLQNFGDDIVWKAKRHYDQEVRENEMLRQWSERQVLAKNRKKRAKQLKRGK